MAENLKQEIERLYLERTQVATVTVASSEPLGYVQFARGLAPHTDEEVRNLSGQRVAGDLLFSHFEALLTDRTKRKNFGELVSALTGKLQQVKRMRELAPFFETLPVYRRCDSCGKRAAQRWDVTKEEWLCEVCNQKRQKGRQERRDFVTAFQEWARQKQGFEGKFRHPEDLDTLAGAGGRIALLYADGNNMGELLQLMPSPASYRHFSQVLESATRDSLFAAIWTVFGEDRLKDASQPVPFEIIALGGDDVVVIVPAEYGWALALQLLKEFENHPGIQRLEQELTERLGESILRRPISLTLSAGLAIADVKYPVSFLFALAEGLLKQAKKLARERRTSTLCHLWLRAPVISEKADAVLDALYKRNSQQQTAMLTARPYTREDAEKLTNLAQQLTELPTTQRRTLAEALERGVHVSLNYALYQAARRKGRQEVLLRAFEELGSLLDPTPVGFWFWRNVPQEGWKTTLLDALELIELGALKPYSTGRMP
jgi:CRISPR-associated protein Cmr2